VLYREEYRTNQLITYLGNKRKLLPFIEHVILRAKHILGKEKLTCLDGFSGSGTVARMLKSHSNTLIVNDLETYSYVFNKCYLTNKSAVNVSHLQERIGHLNNNRLSEKYERGFIEELYAPRDDDNIQPGERVFYTNTNAKIIDNLRRQMKPYEWHSLAPLLYKASVHNNTCGVFKGYYSEKKVKDSLTLGKFGGQKENCLERIKGEITLDVPVFSEYECDLDIFQEDINGLVEKLPEIDVAYYDPPYNQHPYGSNYFMLNLIAAYERPDLEQLSKVAGIPKDWNKSLYNKRAEVKTAIAELVKKTPAKIIVMSYSNGGFLSQEEMVDLLSVYGSVTVEEQDYITFRAGKNLRDKKTGNLTRDLKTKEYLFVLEKK